MKRKGMIITACLLASVLSVASVSADDFYFDQSGSLSVPGFSDPLTPQSNTNAASAEQLGTAVDGFNSVLGWSDVGFDKWFGYMGVAPVSVASLPGINGISRAYLLNIGYATRIGGLYLSAYYSGKIADGATDRTETITGTNADQNGEYVNVGTTEETSNSGQPVTTTLNNASVLIGLGNMGIKVGFYGALKTSDAPGGTLKSDEQLENGFSAAQEYTGYQKSEGILIPSVSWGMPLSLGSMVLKPSATIAVNIIRNNESYEFAGKDNNLSGSGTDDTYTNLGAKGPNTSTGEQSTINWTREYGYVQPDITVGAGIDFPKSGTAAFGVGLEYRTNFNIYATPEGDIGAGTFTSLTGTLDAKDGSGTYSKSTSYINATEKSDWNNRITPSFWYSNELSEKVTLGFGAEIAVITGTNKSQDKSITTVDTSYTYYNQTNDDRNYTYTSTSTFQGSLIEKTWLGIAPALNLGVGYKINDRWGIEGGLAVTFPEYQSVTTVTGPNKGTETTTETTYEGGEKTSSSSLGVGNQNTVDSRRVQSNWTEFKATYNLGFTFAFTPALVLDARIGLSDINGTTGFQNINWVSPNYALAITGSF
ncbi:hypothetical protein FACS1894141_3700 [Spirochaetia bacterium]|nr:hypothetical protein FACS1894141_3700 [Spirochaetia bacterium]